MTVPNNANYLLVPVIAIPSALEITAVAQSNPMMVTVSANSDQMNTYIPGQAVKFNVPVTYGMWQLNQMTLPITAISGNVMTFSIDSTIFDPFAIPAEGALQPASLAPSGSRNLQYSNSTNQVGFQSLNNVGN